MAPTADQKVDLHVVNITKTTTRITTESTEEATKQDTANRTDSKNEKENPWANMRKLEIKILSKNRNLLWNHPTGSESRTCKAGKRNPQIERANKLDELVNEVRFPRVLIKELDCHEFCIPATIPE